jgi:signal transduction histidine kinase
MWRIGCFFAFLFVGLIGLVALLSWVIGGALNSGNPWAIVLVIGLVLFVMFAVIGRAVRRTARPVGDLIEASGRVEVGDFSTRVEERGPREVRALVRAFNAMSTRLEETEDHRRSGLADVSHELRTPLAVIQGNVEAIRDGVYPADVAHLEPILDEIGVMERLIGDLRTLSLVDAGRLVLHREPTDVGQLLTDISDGYQAQAAQARVQLVATVGGDSPTLDVDPARIREVLANLLTNALRHTPAGGTVEMALTRGAEGAGITVTDTGSGMTPADLEHVFDRFYRSADSPGSGLGLSIARDLVEAHGGTITATSEPGNGTTVRVELPRS